MGQKFSFLQESSPEVDITLTSIPIIAQNALLQEFCGNSCHIESKVCHLPNGYVNYVEVVSNATWEKHQKSATVDAASSSGANRPNNEKVLVLTPGYGIGIGFYFRNLAELAGIFDRVIAVDWLGMGGSSRYPKQGSPIKRSLSMRPVTPTVASDFFVDQLEALRVALGLEGFVLSGHQFGGYLVGRYALKYPAHIKGLVLISPLGLSAPPPQEMHVKPAEFEVKLRSIHTAWMNNITPQVRSCTQDWGFMTFQQFLFPL